MGTLQDSSRLGQSVWLDNLHRGMLRGDADSPLAKLIGDGLRGMTSNPSIFEKSIGHSNDYDDQLRTIDRGAPDTGNEAAYEQLAIADIQGACDAFRALYDQTSARDGFVSLEVSPRLARDTGGTIAAAKRLHAAVGRPNVMIKIPGTHEGVPAIEATIAAGIHVNTTLLFGVDAYLAAADAYMAGLEQLRARGGSVAGVAGVASFFLSRIDTAVDKLLPEGDKLRGTAAVANAKVAYAAYQGMIASPRWQSLARSGAQPQRLLWASTSTKNPAYDKLLYVAPLIGRDTVNTMPDETLAELRERGAGRLHDGAITVDLDAATRQLADLAGKGISLRAVTDQLLGEGVAAFAKSFDSLLAAVASKRKAQTGPGPRKD